MQIAVLNFTPVQIVLGHCDLQKQIAILIYGTIYFPRPFSIGARCTASNLTSGPLKTLGSFMSFQTYKFGVEPLYLDRANCCAHQSRTSGFSMSRYDDDPGQHHLHHNRPCLHQATGFFSDSYIWHCSKLHMRCWTYSCKQLPAKWVPHPSYSLPSLFFTK